MDFLPIAAEYTLAPRFPQALQLIAPVFLPQQACFSAQYLSA